MATRRLPLLVDHGGERPRTRAACVNGPRPCPWVSCRHHLEHEDESCSLDVADQGEHTLAEVGELLGLTRERIRQIELKALDVIGSNYEVAEALDDDTP